MHAGVDHLRGIGVGPPAELPQQLGEPSDLFSILDAVNVEDFELDRRMSLDMDLGAVLSDLDTWSAGLFPSEHDQTLSGSPCRTDPGPLNSLGSHASSHSTFHPWDRDGTPGASGTDADDPESLHPRPAETQTGKTDLSPPKASPRGRHKGVAARADKPKKRLKIFPQ